MKSAVSATPRRVMKVNELIKELNLFDKELEVCVSIDGKAKSINIVDLFGKENSKYCVILDSNQNMVELRCRKPR